MHTHCCNEYFPAQIRPIVCYVITKKTSVLPTTTTDSDSNEYTQQVQTEIQHCDDGRDILLYVHGIELRISSKGTQIFTSSSATSCQSSSYKMAEHYLKKVLSSTNGVQGNKKNVGSVGSVRTHGLQWGIEQNDETSSVGSLAMKIPFRLPSQPIIPRTSTTQFLIV